MTKQKKYTGYGYHGGGRKPLAPEQRHRTSVTICGTMAEIEKLRALAKEADKSVSRYVLDIIGDMQKPFDYWDKELQAEASDYYDKEHVIAEMQDFCEGYIIGAQRQRPRT